MAGRWDLSARLSEGGQRRRALAQGGHGAVRDGRQSDSRRRPPGVVTTRDGLKLRYASWRPTVRRLAGTLLLVQGRAEFIEKYFETIAAFRRRASMWSPSI